MEKQPGGGQLLGGRVVQFDGDALALLRLQREKPPRQCVDRPLRRVDRADVLMRDDDLVQSADRETGGANPIPLFGLAAIDVHDALQICRGPAQHFAQPGAQNEGVVLAHRSENPASKVAGADAVVLHAPSGCMQQVTPAGIDQTDPAVAVEDRCRYRQRVERCLDQLVRVLARRGRDLHGLGAGQQTLMRAGRSARRQSQ